MLVKNIFFGIIILCSFHLAKAQSIREHGLSRQLNFRVDEDFFLLTDKYYTFGMDIEYSSLVDPNAKLYRRFSPQSDSAKLLLNFQYGNKIFTPNSLSTRQTKFMDRPYAGWNFVRTGLTFIPSDHVVHDVGLEAGLVGKVSGMGQFQQWWHKVVNIYPVNGWDSQIANEFVVNMYYNNTRSWRLTPHLDLVSIGKIIAGTGMNKLGEEVNIRIGRFNPLNNSSFANSRVSWNKKSKPYAVHHEAFFFVGAGGEYVLSNIFIEGSLFKNQSPFTKQAKPWLYTNRVGFMYSDQVMTYSVVWYHISREVKETTQDDYLSLAMAVRF